jgi:hypothetical protein
MREETDKRKKMRRRDEKEGKRGRQDEECGTRIAIEEDQNGVFWSLLGDLYTVRSSL